MYFLRGKSFLFSYASTIHTYSVFLSVMGLLHYRLLQYSKCVGCWVKAYKSSLTAMPWIFKVNNEQKRKKFFPITCYPFPFLLLLTDLQLLFIF